MGEQFTKIEMFLLVGHLVHQFHIALPEGATPDTEPDPNRAMIRAPKAFKIVATPR